MIFYGSGACLLIPASNRPRLHKPSRNLSDVVYEGMSGSHHGAVAQLGERLICIQEVAGSIPTSSTMLKLLWP
jgi:hypothetical protein